MGRFLGGRIGNFIQRQTQGFAEDGIHTISDQFYQKSLNGWREGVNASGGDNIITASSGYKYHVFKNPGTFTLTSADPQQVDILIVAGGGSGGSNQGGGGGGGGGVKFLPQHTISPGPYSITVGGGGPASTTTTAHAGQYPTYGGRESTGFGWTCGGGAAGGKEHAVFDPAQNSPNPGSPTYVRGCGGGGTGRANIAGGTGLTSGGRACPQPAPPSDIDAGGGGGGAGGAGQNAPGNYHAGDGGPGLAVPQFPSDDLAPAFPTAWATTVGPDGYYAGGGGGGTELTDVPNGQGFGGVGGGGTGRHAGSSWPEGDRHGTDYTGGGGGGYGYQPDIWAKGGKGVVIVRY